jgi:hypothetical protein
MPNRPSTAHSAIVEKALSRFVSASTTCFSRTCSMIGTAPSAIPDTTTSAACVRSTTRNSRARL